MTVPFHLTHVDFYIDKARPDTGTSPTRAMYAVPRYGLPHRRGEMDAALHILPDLLLSLRRSGRLGFSTFRDVLHPS